MDTIIIFALSIFSFIMSVTLYLVKEGHFAKTLKLSTDALKKENENLISKTEKQIQKADILYYEVEGLRRYTELLKEDVVRLNLEVDQLKRSSSNNMNIKVLHKIKAEENRKELFKKVSKQVRQLSQ